MTKELNLVTDLQATGAIIHLHVSVIAYDLDDLSHHSGITTIYVADLILTHRAIDLHDHDVGDDTIYTS
jgi:hypothetical protein